MTAGARKRAKEALRASGKVQTAPGRLDAILGRPTAYHAVLTLGGQVCEGVEVDDLEETNLPADREETHQ